MSRETLMRVGEPFYTTGQGMGLGVFIARSLIQHSGGTMSIESTLNRGTKVSVTLPRSARGQNEG